MKHVSWENETQDLYTHVTPMLWE